MKKSILFVVNLSLIVCLMFSLILFVACSNNWQNKFDTNYPDLSEAKGWEKTMDVNFGTLNNLAELNAKGWYASPHKIRDYEYWCDKVIDFSSNDYLTIKSYRTTSDNKHICDTCVTDEGVFTGGIETRNYNVDNPDETTFPFQQAFGFFECEVIVPTGTGMWSAFWLQADSMPWEGNKGLDGSEIDIFESSFLKNPTKTGSCIHYDGYDKKHRSKGSVANTGKNLYDNEWHKYALLWTPDSYVFYVDGVVVWATDYGGVSRVPEFLRLTVEIRDTGWGPYGQKIGKFENHNDGRNDFKIKNVTVYQNDNFKEHIKNPSDFL